MRKWDREIEREKRYWHYQNKESSLSPKGTPAPSNQSS